MEECLAILRSLLTGEPASYHGRFFDISDARILPAPDPAIPIIVGGRSDASGARDDSATGGSASGSRRSALPPRCVLRGRRP
jgi:hypothetical protein